MRRRAVLIAAGAAGILLAGGLMREAGRAQRGQELAHTAARLLHPPFDEAPTVADIRATEARLLAEEAAELDDTAQARLLKLEARSLERLQRGDPKAARRELTAASANPPPTLAIVAAAIELADGRAELATKLLQPAFPLQADQLRAWTLASDAARALGQADRALALAQQGLAVHASAALYERRGLAHELLGDLPAARSDLEQAARLDPRPAAPLLQLGRVLRQLGELRAAVLAFHGAAQRNPRDSEAWLGSGICRAALGDHSGARADFERAEELAPTLAEPLIGLGDLDSAEQAFESAERRFRAATQLHPELALGWLKLGNTLMRAGDAAHAGPAFRRAIALTPELGAAHNGLGAALQATGDTHAAHLELTLAARLNPQDPNPFLNLARLYRQQGDTAAAGTALAEAQRRATTDEAMTPAPPTTMAQAVSKRPKPQPPAAGAQETAASRSAPARAR